MKFLKLTNFKLNSEVINELADKISGTTNYSQSLDFAHYPSIVKMLSDNNVPNIVVIYLSTRVGPAEWSVPPINEYNTAGIHAFAPFRVYIPLSGTPPILSDEIDSVELDGPTVVAGDKVLTYSLPAGAASHMLTLIKGDGEFNGRLRFISGTENKLVSFAKFCGLV